MINTIINNTNLDNIFKIYYGKQPIKIGYFKDKLVFAQGLLLSFDWRYLESITVNGQVYYPDALGIVLPKKANVIWSAKPLRYCNIDVDGGEFIMEDHTTIGTSGYVDKLPLNVVFKVNEKYVFTNEINDYIEKLTPLIGLEIIPVEHNVYGNQQAGVVAPELISGTMWNDVTDWTWMTDRGKIVYSSTSNKSANNGYDGDVILPTTYEASGFTRAAVNSNEHYDTTRSTNRFGPSPYASNGSQNSMYITNPSSNALAWFNGEEQTNIIWDNLGEESEVVKKVKDYQISNIDGWFIPSAGEIGYLVARMQEYKDIVEILHAFYQTKKIRDYLVYYWTSNEWGLRTAVENTGYNIATISMSQAYYTKKDKTQVCFCAPFIKLLDDGFYLTLNWDGVQSYTVNSTTYYRDTRQIKFSKPTDVVWSAVLRNGYESNKLSGSFIINADKELSVNAELVGTEMPVVLYDIVDSSMFYTYYPNTYDIERFTPIGVVVIPSEHNVYENGNVGILALKYGSCLTPDEGSIDGELIAYGGGGVNLSITNRPYVNIYTDHISQSGLKAYNINGVANADRASLPCLMPSSIGAQCLCDPYSYYSTDMETQNIPSPYNKDGSRNEDYYTLSYNTLNAMGWFGGKNDTNIMCDMATSQKDWKTDSTLANSGSTGYYPSACAAWRYSTLGTEQGDWYIPSAGETGYICVRKQFITNTITKLSQVFGIDDIQFDGSTLTSTELDGNYYISVGCSTGRVNHVDKSAPSSASNKLFLFTNMNIEEKGKGES